MTLPAITAEHVLAARREIKRRDRERLGAVNLRAEEELREVETQHTALTTERDDLVEAIKRLPGVIFMQNAKDVAAAGKDAQPHQTASSPSP